MTAAAPVREATRRWTSGAATWLVGFATSLIGAEVFYVALTWSAVQVTNAAGVSAILLANALPRAMLLLLGGVLTDRFGPRRVVIASDTARALIMLVTAIALLDGPPGVTGLVVLAVLFGVADGLFLPAVGAMPAFVAPRDALTRLQAFRTITVRAGIFIGAPLGSWLIVQGSVGAAFWANSGLFLASVLALTATRLLFRPAEEPAPAVEAGWGRRLTEGLRLVAAHPTLRLLIGMVAIGKLAFTGPVTVGVPLLSAESGWGAGGIGWLMGAFGVGAAATAGLLAARGTPTRPTLLMGAALTAMGFSLCAIWAAPSAGLTGPFPLAGSTAAALLLGLGAGVYGTLANAAILAHTPSAQLGRVMSVVSLASFVTLPISIAATGALTELTDAALPFLVGGAVMTLAGLAVCRHRGLRRLEL